MARIRRNPLLLAAILIWAAVPFSALGQAPAAAAPQLPPLTAVSVTGSARFSSDQLVAVSGLRLHQAVSLDAFNQVVRQLRASGDFRLVTYHYEYSASQGTHVEFEVTDQSGLLPPDFDNFVWLSKDQLLSLLRGKIPLFCGLVPPGGGVEQRIEAVLEAYLSQHGVSGATVEGLPAESELGGGFTGYKFIVGGVKIPVQRVSFAGAPPDLDKVLQAKAAGLLGTDYSHGRVLGSVAADFLPALRDRGFLQAALSAPVVAISDAAHNGVSVSFTLTPGTQYHWGDIGFQGNAVFDAKMLAGLVKLHSGGIADQSALDQGVSAILLQYQNAGYIRATVEPRFDWTQPGIAAPAIVVTEGPQFHMGTVTFEGVAVKSATMLAGL
jgi:outer membrane protein assembly factor BamA